MEKIGYVQAVKYAMQHENKMSFLFGVENQSGSSYRSMIHAKVSTVNSDMVDYITMRLVADDRSLIH